VPDLALRLVEGSDYDALFAIQQLLATVPLAPFALPDLSDRIACDAHLNRLRADKSMVLRAITVDGHVVGLVFAWDTGHTPQIGFGIDPSRWGEGIATAALIAFTALMKRRPLQASVASDHAAAIRVLEKAGFSRMADGPGDAPTPLANPAPHRYELGFFPAATFIGSVAS